MCRIHSRKEVRRGHACIQLDPLAGINMRLGMRKTCWGWGKEQHLYNTYLPIPSFLLSKKQPSRKPAHTGGSWPPAGCGLAALQVCSADKLWIWEQETTPPPTTITTPLPVVPGSVAKRGVFSETPSSLRSRTPCRVGLSHPEHARGWR